MQNIINEKTFMKSLKVLVVPIAMQQLISSALNLIDTIMIGALGKQSISAVGLANQVFFLLILFLFGVNSGVGVYIAQYWGKGDTVSIHKALWLSLLTGVAVSMPFFVGGCFFPEQIVSIFSNDYAVVTEGAQYLRITSWSYLIMSVSFAYAIASRNIGSARMPMVAGAISLVFNTFFNYMLIFGVGIFPKLGVEGAAIATTGARVLELIILVGYVYSRSHPLRVSFKDIRTLSWKFANPIIKTGAPVFLNEAFWAIGMTLYTVAYARSGTAAYAAVQIATTVERMFFIIAFGLASACAVMIGNALGGNDIDLAKEYAKRFIKIGIWVSCTLGLIMALIAYPITQVFNVTDEIKKMAVLILFIYAFTHVFKMITAILIVGVFRGGGDTTFSFKLEICCVYLIGVPVAFIGALYFKWPIHYVILLVTTEEIVKSIIGLKRMKSGIWANNLVEFH